MIQRVILGLRARYIQVYPDTDTFFLRGVGSI